MKTLSLSFVLLLSFGLSQISCTQPPVACTVSSSASYAAKYQLIEGDGPCAELKGDHVGFAAYNARNDKGLPDLSQVSLAVRTELVGAQVAHAKDYGIVDTTEGHAPHAFGDFTSGEPEGEICTAELAPVAQVLEEVPADPGDPEDPEDDLPLQPALDVEESWSDLQVYVSAAALGTQVKGRYTFTDNIAGCTAQYDVLAVFPAVPCADEDAEGNLVVNEDYCSPVAIPEKNIPVGSGISPDFPVRCDPDLFLCVLDAEPSSQTFPIVH